MNRRKALEATSELLYIGNLAVLKKYWSTKKRFEPLFDQRKSGTQCCTPLSDGAMGIDPSDIGDHAERVDEEYSDEPARRSVISRKYYHLFHLVRSSTKSHPESSYNFEGGDHGEAKRVLRELVDGDLADSFDDLRKARNRADYDLDDRVDPLDHRRVSKKYERVKNRIENQIIEGD